jgi:hypothetical protein
MKRRTLLQLIGLAPAVASLPAIASPKVSVWAQRATYQCSECTGDLRFEEFKYKAGASYAIASCCRDGCRQSGRRLRIPLEYLQCEVQEE